jgi:hypothetical protein
MSTAKKIIEEIEQLPPSDRRKILTHLERSATRRSSPEKTAGARPTKRKGPYAALLEMAGTGQGDHVGVSGDKYRHLASAYRPLDEPE